MGAAGIPVGIIVGAVCALFGRVLLAIGTIRDEHIVLFLPFLALMGLAIVFAYRTWGKGADRGMGLVFDVGHGREDAIRKARPVLSRRLGYAKRSGTIPRTPPSSRSSHSLRSRPPAYPLSEPSAATTRWHGTIIEMGLRATAAPTARGDTTGSSFPGTRWRAATRSAISPYVATSPRGIESSSHQTSR